MSTSHPLPTPDEPGRFRSGRLFTAAAVAGVAGLVLAVILGFIADHALRRFLFSYLVAVSFFLAIAIGALFFVLLQHLTHAGWSVNVRRVAESMAMTVPIIGVLTIPVLVSVAFQKGTLYPWALPMSAAETTHHGPAAKPDPHAARRIAPDARPADAHAAPGEKNAEPAEKPAAAAGHPTLDALTLSKRPWLNPWFFILRMIIWFAVWTIIARYYWIHSIRQDLDGDAGHTMLMQKYAGVSILITGLTITYASFDLLMSLDPHWYSTIFGVYFIAAAAVSFFAAIIVAIVLLQRGGHLKVVGVDHFHDLGKYLFGFVFFWGYIAFSQYMLLWYANIPETAEWLSRHGATTVIDMAYTSEGQLQDIPDLGGTWKGVAVVLLFGHLLIPFAGLMSRHVKRSRAVLTFWAVWLLVFHYVNMYWVVMPEMRVGFAPGLIDLACFVGVAGIVIAAWARLAGSQKLRPVNDPRMDESLAFTNI